MCHTTGTYVTVGRENLPADSVTSPDSGNGFDPYRRSQHNGESRFLSVSSDACSWCCYTASYTRTTLLGLMVILKHTKILDDGRCRYRRRFPENVRADLGWEFIRTSDGPLSERSLLRWYQDREADFEAAVKSARLLSASVTLSDKELFDAARERANQLLDLPRA